MFPFHTLSIRRRIVMVESDLVASHYSAKKMPPLIKLRWFKALLIESLSTSKLPEGPSDIRFSVLCF